MGRNLEKMLDQLESLADLIETLEPLADDAFGKAVDIMAGLEAKGYFSFTQGGMKLIDNIVTSFSAEDVNRLGDNIVLILNTIKDMTQPEIIGFVRNTLLVAEKEIEKPVDISYLGLVRQMRDPASTPRNGPHLARDAGDRCTGGSDKGWSIIQLQALMGSLIRESINKGEIICQLG